MQVVDGKVIMNKLGPNYSINDMGPN